MAPGLLKGQRVHRNLVLMQGLFLQQRSGRIYPLQDIACDVLVWQPMWRAKKRDQGHFVYGKKFS